MENLNFASHKTAIKTKQSISSKEILKALNVNPNLTVCDYGCGKGRNSFYLIKNMSKKIDLTCVDIQEQLNDSETEMFELEKKGCKVGTFEILKKESIDTLMCCHVLNVISSDMVKKQIVKNIYDCLKFGGVARFEVRTKKDIENSKTKEKYGKGWKIKKGKNWTYQESLTSKDMVELMESVGFKVVDHIFNNSNHRITVIKE